MSIYENFRSIARLYRTAREAARTERIIAHLPNDIRKDIGWPDAVVHDVTRRASH